MDSGRFKRYSYRSGTEPSQTSLAYAAELRDYTYMINRLNRENQSLSLNLVQLLNENKALRLELHDKRIKEFSTKQSASQLNSYRNYLSRCAGSAYKSKKLQPTGKAERQPQTRLKNNSVYMANLSNQQTPDLSSCLKSPTIIEELAQSKFTPQKKKGLCLSKQILQTSQAENQLRKQSQKVEQTKIGGKAIKSQNMEDSSQSKLKQQQSKTEQTERKKPKQSELSSKKTNYPYKFQLKKVELSGKQNQSTYKKLRKDHLESMYSYLYSPIKTYNEII